MPSEKAPAPSPPVEVALAPPPVEGWWLSACCLVAATVMGLTLQLTNGTLRSDALVGLSVTLVLSAGAVWGWRLGRGTPRVEAVLAALLGGALLLQLRVMALEHPGMYLNLNGPWPYAPFYWGLAAEALVVGAMLAGSERLRRVLVLVLLGLHLFLGAWMLRISPSPYIDVFIFESQAVEALLKGTNPYAITFPNIYGHGLFYGEGLTRDGRLLFGFPYPPLSLYFSVLGKVLGGDPRWAQLVALTLAAGLMAFARGGRLGVGAAALLLMTPRGLFVLEQAWTEPFLILLLAASVFCACRFPRALPYVFGLLLAVKQYTVFMVPLVLLLTPLRGRALWGLLWRAGATGLGVSLPLVLANPSAFIHSVVTLQLHQPFRMDSLSYLSWWVSQGHPQPPVWIAFAGVAVALALALWRAPRTPAGFAAALAFVYCVFFALNKQAFSNYYYFVVGALCVALAAASPSPAGPEGRSAPSSP
ncbi:hypothetical protein [Hyalangium rubrum]|uniref:DUF2029 domain-containing protein n=1 Tax=Hyalangium rubrum TaxID=3103134 RepID=A0ABU5HCB5_9BACT|nr:hypothetical protein [Hyalangium sp. s54d21]MDY7230472.1 hypothetical protein [Hyalangium sp. s54d21]